MHGLALKADPSQTTHYRTLDDVMRIRDLEAQIDAINKAWGVVISNGGAVSGPVTRHVMPAINEAMCVRRSKG